jgi:hypothetical protein
MPSRNRAIRLGNRLRREDERSDRIEENRSDIT